MKPVRAKTTSELVDQMFDALVPAWLGSSAGVFTAFASVFWRLVIYPPRLVIDYGNGHEVWSFGGELVRGTKPETHAGATAFCVFLFIVGCAFAWVMSKDWWEAKNELARRRALQDGGKADG